MVFAPFAFMTAAGFCLIVPTIILVVLILTMRDKGSDALAVLSLVSGILGFFLLPIVGGIAAVVSGNMALNSYQEQAVQNGNVSLARAGVILGWIGLGIWLVGVVGFILFQLPARVVTGF